MWQDFSTRLRSCEARDAVGMPKVVRCNVLLAQALEAPADAVCFSYERVAAPNGAGFTIMPNLGGAVEPPASFQPSLPLPVRGDCGQTKSMMSVPRTSPNQYLRSTRSSPAPRSVFETSLSESEGNLVRSWMPRHTLDLSFEGLELPFRECGGASRHKGHWRILRSHCFHNHRLATAFL